MPYGAIQTPVRDGYTFAGWYTESGAAITASTLVSQNHNVTAAWISGTVPVHNSLFTDVTAGDWFYSYVTDLGAAQIVAGYPDGAFRPNAPVSGGEALKLILRAVGFEQQNPTGRHWASGYLTLALSKGIVAEGEITDLDAAVSRQLVARIAAKSLGLEPIETLETTFADTTDGFVLALYHCNIVTGNVGAGGLLYYPNDSIKRSEISAVIWRITNSGIVQS
jgi:uncharacterized repeat protein (TIGR02543 family)